MVLFPKPETIVWQLIDFCHFTYASYLTLSPIPSSCPLDFQALCLDFSPGLCSPPMTYEIPLPFIFPFGASMGGKVIPITENLVLLTLL